MKKMLIALGLLLTLTFTACGSNLNYNNLKTMGNTGEGYDGYTEEYSLMSPDLEIVPGQPDSSMKHGEKIVKVYNISGETRNFDSDIEMIENIVEKYKGFIENNSIDSYSKDERSSSFVIRIPNENVEDFVNELNKEISITHKSMSTEDRTTEYFDNDTRIKIAETKRDRLLELLEKAETVEDIITVENELSNITYELEYLTSANNYIDRNVNNSTVNLQLRELNNLELGYNESKFSDDIVNTWNNSINGIVALGKSIVLGLVSLIVYIPFIVLAIIVIIYIPKKSKKHIKDIKNIEIKDLDENNERK